MSGKVIVHPFIQAEESVSDLLADDERAILRALHDARGFFVSRGLSIADVMKRTGFTNPKDAVKIEKILESMERLKLAKKLASGNWRRV